MSEDYAGRVTVDIDAYVDDFDLTATRAYHNLKHLADAIEVHISSSGQGVHIVGWFEEDLSTHERLQLRRGLCDDPNRIRIDVERALNGVYTGVLWTEKNREAGPEEAPEDRPGKDRDFSDIHDALRHINMTERDDHERMKRLAEYGHKRAPDLARHAHGGDR